MEQDRKNNPDRFAHIWLGDYAPQAVGAIWNMANIHSNRIHDIPTIGRIVVSVDPAVSNTENSDEHGIIVGGLGEDGKGYVPWKQDEETVQKITKDSQEWIKVLERIATALEKIEKKIK